MMLSMRNSLLQMAKQRRLIQPAISSLNKLFIQSTPQRLFSGSEN